MLRQNHHKDEHKKYKIMGMTFLPTHRSEKDFLLYHDYIVVKYNWSSDILKHKIAHSDEVIVDPHIDHNLNYAATGILMELQNELTGINVVSIIRPRENHYASDHIPLNELRVLDTPESRKAVTDFFTLRNEIQSKQKDVPSIRLNLNGIRGHLPPPPSTQR